MNEQKGTNLYRLIPMDMNQFDVDDLLDEQKRHEGKIEWESSNQKFNDGDIVYIYCKNLPDGSNRILFRANVVPPELNKKAKSFWIGNVQTICLDNTKKFSLDILKQKYGLNINQTKQILATFDDYNNYKKDLESITKDRYGSTNEDDVIKYKKHLQLIMDLERIYKNEKSKKSLEDAKKYFNNQILCECCEILGFSNKMAKNRTFRKNNGLIYNEVHHFLMQNLYRKTDPKWFEENSWFKKEDIKWLDSEFNRINLCPVCHREFHYGEFDYNNFTKKEIMETLWVKHEFGKHLKELGKNQKEIQQIKEYIFNQYIFKEER